MPREYKGHYSRKHPPGTHVSPQLEKAIRTAAVKGRISCKKANQIARAMALSPGEVGQAADLLETGIAKCQLGLFSHADGNHAESNPVDENLKQSIEGALYKDRLNCADAWHLADTLGLTRREIGRACKILKIKISRCQLGAF